MIRLRTAVLLVVAWAAAAQTQRARRPAAPPGDDAQIEAAIRARFSRSKIAEDRFQVRVQGGVATIEGQTNVIQRKGVATRLAKAAGARQVVNRITIGEAARRKAAANLVEGRRRAQVKRGEARSEGRGNTRGQTALPARLRGQRSLTP